MSKTFDCSGEKLVRNCKENVLFAKILFLRLNDHVPFILSISTILDHFCKGTVL